MYRHLFVMHWFQFNFIFVLLFCTVSIIGYFLFFYTKIEKEKRNFKKIIFIIVIYYFVFFER